MYLSRRYLLPALFCILIAAHSYQLAPGSDQGTDGRANRIEKLREFGEFLEDELQTIRALLARQASSEAEVDHVRANLAMARHDLALLENKSAEVTEQCRQLVEIREREFQRIQKLAVRSLKPKLKLHMALRRLACWRYRLNQIEGKPDAALSQLQLIVELCKQDVAELTEFRAKGAATVTELNLARHRHTIASYYLACKQDDPQSVIPQLRLSVELCKQEWEQVKHLVKVDFADLPHEYLARCHLLHAKLLLASLEEEHNVVIDRFNELISTHEETIPRLDRYGFERDLRILIDLALARDRERKELFLRDGYLEDLPLAELEP